MPNPPSNKATSTDPQTTSDLSGGPTGNAPTPQHQAEAEGERTYHDSLTGARVTATGEFVDESRKGTGPIPANRIVADDWPQVQREVDGLAPVSKTDATVQQRTTK